MECLWMSLQALLNKTTARRSERHQSTRREEEVKPARVAGRMEVSIGNEVKLSLGQVSEGHARCNSAIR